MTGHAGALWHVRIVQRGRYTQVARLWEDFTARATTPDVLVHLLIPDEVTVHATFSAVDNPQDVANTIGCLFDSVLTTSTHLLPVRARTDLLYDPFDDLPQIGPCIHIKTVWALTDDYIRTAAPVFDATRGITGN